MIEYRYKCDLCGEEDVVNRNSHINGEGLMHSSIQPLSFRDHHYTIIGDGYDTILRSLGYNGEIGDLCENCSNIFKRDMVESINQLMREKIDCLINRINERNIIEARENDSSDKFEL